MTAHAKDSLRRPSISEVFYLALAVAAAETSGAKGLFTGQDSKLFNLVAAGTTAVSAVVADEGAIAEEKQVGVGVEEGAASVASKAVEVPSISSWKKDN